MQKSGMNITVVRKQLLGIIVLVSLILVSCATVPYSSSPPEKTLLSQEESFVTVNANGPWRSSGVIVRTDNQYQVKATGLLRHGPHFWDAWVGPDGVGAASVFSIVQGFTMCTLIAKIGDGSPFAVGGSLLLKPDQEGLLYFKMNRSTGEGSAQGKMDVTIKNVSTPALPSHSGAFAIAPPVAESKAEATAKAKVKSEANAKAELVGLEPTTAVIALPAVSPQSGSFVTEKKNNPEIKTVDNYVAVFDFEVRDKDKDISRPLADKVIHVFSESEKYEVIDRGNMNKILGEQKFQMSGCVAQECKVEAGQILGVGKIVNGSVGLVGKTYYLTIQLIDVKTGKVELSAEDECKCEIDELLGSTRRLAKKLLGEKVEQPVSTAPKPVPTTIAIVPPAVPTKETARDGRFIAYDNGTVLDTRTNLMWAATDNGANINWAGAKSYCENYRDGGYTDWRMPTQDELAGLFDSSKSYKAPRRGYIVHLTELIQLSVCCPWASETRGPEAAAFSFWGNGDRYRMHQFTETDYRALPVRSVK